MMDETMRAIENRRLFRRIGDFLSTHTLDPTPANYALAHRALTEEESPTGRAVKAAAADGVRIGQREADRIAALEVRRGEPRSTAHPPASIAPDLFAAARRQVDDFAAVVERTRAQTSSYGGDLERSAADLDRAQPASVVELIRLTRAMMDRTRAAERQLVAAREEAGALREKLGKVEEQARSDPLTRLPNRRAFEEKLEQLRSARVPHSIAICDLDHFKQINDTHGHSVGDRVLRTVAQALEEKCAGHMLARLGGEEFVLLFERTDVTAAADIVDAARESLARREFKLRENDAPLGAITFSAGIASFGPPDYGSALERADALLYEAKNAGRNCVRPQPGGRPARA